MVKHRQQQMGRGTDVLAELRDSSDFGSDCSSASSLGNVSCSSDDSDKHWFS